MNVKKLLLILLLANFVFAGFQLQDFEITIKLNEDGNANVEEKIRIMINDSYSRQLYESGYDKNALSNWQEITNIDEIKIHLNRKNVDLKNIIILPQPPRKSISEDIWFTQIIISYIASPYYDKDGNITNNTGITKIEKYKPRTTRFTLNESAFNLQRTENGDIRLDKKTTISFILPTNAIIVNINPKIENLNTTSKTLNWSGLTLVQFSLIYEIEQSLDKEVVGFFSDFQKNISAIRFGQEELTALAIAVILICSYFYLKISRR
ncbi:MAG: hypothetical protein AB1391_01225 [Candidatus Micrarchaeota archaeon]